MDFWECLERRRAKKKKKAKILKRENALSWCAIEMNGLVL